MRWENGAKLCSEGVCRTAFADSMVQWDIHMYPGGLGGTAPNSVIENNVVELGIWLHPPEYEMLHSKHLSRSGFISIGSGRSFYPTARLCYDSRLSFV